jgi:hypothetical protein
LVNTRITAFVFVVAVGLAAVLLIGSAIVEESAERHLAGPSVEPAATLKPSVIPSVSPSGLTPPSPPGSPAADRASAEMVAEAKVAARHFAEAYASFDWRDPDPNLAVKDRMRPWATDRLNTFLAGGSSAAYLTQQRIEAQEVATPQIVFMDLAERYGPNKLMFLTLLRKHRVSASGPVDIDEQFLELTLIREGDRWLVDEMLT